jgi:hypothetical protein
MSCLLLRTQGEYFIHLKAAGDLMGDKEHGDPVFETVNGCGKMLGRVLIEVGDRLVKDQDLGTFEQGTGNGQAYNGVGPG